MEAEGNMEYIVSFTCGALVCAAFSWVVLRAKPAQRGEERKEAEKRKAQEDADAEQMLRQWDAMMRYTGRQQDG